jgi:predicted permease
VYFDFARREGLFTEIGAAAQIRSRNVRLERREETMPVQAITPSLFPALGVEPVLGRSFTREDAGAAAPPVVLLSYTVWQRDFGRRSDALGAVVRLDGIAHTVIGVLPERFHFDSISTAMWTPVSEGAAGNPPLDVVVRAPNVSEKALVLAFQEPLSEYRKTLGPGGSGMFVRFRPIYATSVREALDLTRSFVAAGAVFLVIIAVSLTLAITCANVAIVMIAQWSARQQETAIRAVLGAGRLRIVRMLALEVMIVAVCAGALALAATIALRAVVLRVAPLSVFFDFSMDFSVLATVTGVTLLAGLLSGLMPALMQTRKLQFNPGAVAQTTSKTQHRFRSALVIAEITVVIALLVVMGAMVNSYSRIMAAGGGFHIDRLVTLRVDAESGVRIPEIVERLRALPGIESATAASALPIFNSDSDQRAMTTSGGDPAPAGVVYAGSDYFRTAGLTLVRGREFSVQDDVRDSQVAVVNETLARRLWPGADPIGQHIWVNAKPSEVVALAADFVSVFRTTSPPTVYVPLSQRVGPVQGQQFLIRTAGDPMRVISSLRSEIGLIASDQAVSRVSSVKNQIEAGAAEMLVGVYIFLPLVFVGLLLSAAGMYGILAFTISRRMKELAIRMAVGATARDMLWLVAGETSRLVITGTATGTLVMLWLVRTAQHESYVFAKPSIAMFAVPVVILLITAAIATWIPARRAMSVDPATTLRADG